MTGETNKTGSCSAGGCGAGAASPAGGPGPERADAPVSDRANAHCPLPRWARRLGAAAFLFFLIKGLLWLLIPTAIAVVAWMRS